MTQAARLIAEAARHIGERPFAKCQSYGRAREHNGRQYE
jgi:hypothetical protein